ncbi:MAG: hypothetical protein ACR2NN_29020 [Bryobacteraceae bacterium]
MRNFLKSKLLLAALLSSAVAVGQYKSESAGAAPSEVAGPIAQALQKDGSKITNNGQAYCEIWFRSQKPAGAAAKEEGATLAGIPQGALLGVIRFDAQGQDRRGQGIKPGVYTLRYGLIPINGDHQGAAPQRDFLVLSPAAMDKDLNATPAFDALMDMSRKASGTPHPAVLSFWKADSDAPGLAKQGDADWVLQTKLGDVPVAVIVVGVATS